MTFGELRDGLSARLDEGGRGDRAWWLLTRVHLTAPRLQQIASYLYDASGGANLVMTATHYANLAQTLGIATPNPALLINRHYFLAMDTPLQLLKRADGRHWREVLLDDAGIELATETDTAAVLEGQLLDIRFCREPWYSPTRVAEYEEFDIRPYQVVLEVMQSCYGYIDVDEFDLFVSRTRASEEVGEAIDRILTFRTLSDAQKQELRNLVSARMPGGTGNDPVKPYNNWRDMARHTFAFFSLGQSAVQIDNRLHLTQHLAVTASAPSDAAQALAHEAPTTTLLIPTDVAPPDLLTPPPLPQSNTGAAAELLVGKIFAAAEWQVVYYNQRRGYGFDLWVSKGDQAFLVEVKSFVGDGGAVTLTSLEHEAAHHHGANYLLVVVEHVNTDKPALHVVQNPAAALAFAVAQSTSYSASRAAWLAAAKVLAP